MEPPAKALYRVRKSDVKQMFLESLAIDWKATEMT